jgi:hypothetical protein
VIIITAKHAKNTALLSAKKGHQVYILMCEKHKCNPDVKDSVPYDEYVDRHRDRVANRHEPGLVAGIVGIGEWSTIVSFFKYLSRWANCTLLLFPSAQTHRIFMPVFRLALALDDCKG